MAIPAIGAVDGVVMNGTTGKPQPNATVTLYQFTQSGPEPLDSVKSGPDGKWSIDKPFQGMGFLQAAYDGVTYNHTLRQGAPLNGIQIQVYQTTASMVKSIRSTNHMLLLEPRGDQLIVRESYFFLNDGNTTWNDARNGTLRFFVAKEPLSRIEVKATAPQGLPIDRAAEKGSATGEMKVDFPIKPGESRIDLSYILPYQDPSRFQTKFLIPSMQTMIAVPNGVTLEGEGIKDEGKEPTTQASVFRVEKDVLDLKMSGNGEMTSDEASRGPSIEQIHAKPYEKLGLILGLAFGILMLGFLILYRMNPAPAKPGPKPAPVKGKR
jgi:5-hydroxyisourate hydrolase-like protein (transthyretin family)